LILLAFRLMRGVVVLHVGLDLSRKRVDVCLISGEGELVEHSARLWIGTVYMG
jgi:hypothetical protein